jgi:signal transduction histidine kinase/CheY-like chemotaxis protein
VFGISFAIVHRKKSLAAVSFFLSFLVILGMFLYANSLISFSMRTMEYNIEHRLIAEGKRLAAMAGAGELDRYRAAGDMELPEYRALRLLLLDFSREADILYAYYMRPVKDGMQYIAAIAGVDIEDEPIVRARRLVSALTVIQAAAVAVVFASGIIYLIYLYRRTETAREASSAKSGFLFRMSHEIRTPLNAIIGMAELLLRGELPGEARGQARDIRQAGNNVVSIINNILDFSKIEAGRLEIIPAKYRLSSLIGDLANIIRTRIGEKPLRFFTDIGGGIPNSLVGDEARLRQILLNLLSNAVKYTEKGHVGLTVTAQKRDGKQVWLKIAVADTGRGIRPEERAKLFGEFARVDTGKNRGVEGTGLGLAIARRLCTAMGGDITVESEYGKGSTFTAVIPQTVESETPFAAAEEPGYYDDAGNAGAGSPARFTFPGARLLVADDIAANLQVAAGLLAPYLAAVDTCRNGLRAVEMVKRAASEERGYDLILMDHMMPEMDGIEAAAVIRAWEKEQRDNAAPRAYVPIIALTANAVVGMRELYIEKGFDDFLSKPIDVLKLDELLTRWIAKEKRAPGRGDDTAASGPRPNGSSHDSPLPATHSLEIEARKLDKLNHYRAAFEMSRTSGGLEIDADYYGRFTSLVESFDTLPDNLQADKALLTEAGRNKEAQEILRTLPAFCENIAAVYRGKVKNKGTEDEITGGILRRLRRAIQDGDTNAAGKMVTEMGAKNLTAAERELYFKLYDLFMDDNAEKALETVDRFLAG